MHTTWRLPPHPPHPPHINLSPKHAPSHFPPPPPPLFPFFSSYLDRRRDRDGPAGAFTYEVILVDDGSSDATARVGFDAARERGLDTVRVLRLPANRGKGAAVRAGALVARGDRLLFMDADGATRMADLDGLDAALDAASIRGWPGSSGSKQGGGKAAPPAAAGAPPPLLGAAFGSRAHLAAGAAAKRAWHRNLLTRGFHLLVIAVAGPAIRDTQCGFKLFTRSAGRALFGNQRLSRWCFDVELAVLAARFGIPIAEVSVGWAEVPGSKVRLSSIAHMFLELCALGVGYGSGAWAARGEAELVADAVGQGG
jgi:dolichyl-phosphate beta-glucosyltransferase